MEVSEGDSIVNTISEETNIEEPKAHQPPIQAESAITVTSPEATSNTTVHTDIRKIIGINDKYLFISELFNNNSGAYEEVLNKLNSFQSYPEAISWLDELHSENNWNDDNDNVILFYNLLNHYFASK